MHTLTRKRIIDSFPLTRTREHSQFIFHHPHPPPPTPTHAHTRHPPSIYHPTPATARHRQPPSSAATKIRSDGSGSGSVKLELGEGVAGSISIVTVISETPHRVISPDASGTSWSDNVGGMEMRVYAVTLKG
jgi:hypothetical protein